ncbi:hypothetical protein ACI2IY_07470 [Lysobacter enzymogenes]|uniref:hypothetical protein n=1 Tax=Lysobacter enzymogenes TaxID=69 RepID=UPI003850C8A5
MLELACTAATRSASFRAETFATRAQIAALASALREWSLSGDGPQVQWGVFEERWAGGAASIRFAFDPPGRVAVRVRLQDRFATTCFGSHADEAELYLTSEPALMDRFADELERMARWEVRGAALSACGPPHY